MDKTLDVKEEEVKLPEEPSTSEETTEEVPEVKEEPKVEDATETKEETKPTETETAESKGANQRIRELNQRTKLAEEKALQSEEKVKSLSERLAEITEPIGLSGAQAPTNYPQYKPDQEIPVEQLQQDVATTANAIVELKIKQNNAINRINNEAIDAVRKYSQLDPESENFNRELSDSVIEATDAYVYKQPYTAEVGKFVDRFMKPYLRAITKEVGQVTENIAKQVSETALRPTSVHKEEKSASEKSMAELEQELGIVNS